MIKRKYRIFVSSPSDVRPERAVAERVIAKLAREFAYHCDVVSVIWEHEPLLASLHFQDMENIPPPRTADFCITILWSTLGVALPADKFRGAITGSAVTGTEWEFEDALSSWRADGRPKLMFYQKTAEVLASLSDQAALDERLRQKRALEAFVRRWFKPADSEVSIAAHTLFATTAEFEDRLETHLRALLLRRVADDLGLDADSATITWTGPPWPALAPFNSEQAPIFFGRSRARNELREVLAAQSRAGNGFVLVIGASGAGKSSLVQAGLLPDLVLPGMIGNVALVRSCVMRPSLAGADPLLALASSMFSATALPELADLQYTPATIAQQVRQNPLQACFVVQQGLARAADGKLTTLGQARLVVVVDQLEELFTVERISSTDREIFVAVLATLARSGMAWVVGTLRADFFGSLEHLPSLAELSEGGRYLVLPPNPTELSEIANNPARAAGLNFEVDPTTGSALDSAIVASAASDPGALPLLSFVLDAFWRQPREGATLTWAAYRLLGGLDGAIATHAEAVVSALPEQAQAALPAVLLGLVTIREGEQQATGRTAPRQVLARGNDAELAIDRLVEGRLLIADDTEQGISVRFAHEALLRCWPRLAGLIDGSRESLAATTRLRAAYAEWDRNRRPADLLLPPGRRLSEGLELLDGQLHQLNDALIGFIRVSAEAANAARRRRQRVVTGAFVALTVLTAAALLGAWFGLSGRFAAEASRNAFRAQYEIAESRRAQILALALKGVMDPGVTEAVALSVLPRTADGVTGLYTTLLDRLVMAANAKAQRMVLSGHGNAPVFAAFSPDGKRIVTASLDRKARIWSASTGALLMTISGHADQIESAVYSPDGRRILTASDDTTAAVWDATTGHRLLSLTGHSKPVFGAAFSADGQRIVTASGDNTARVWDATTGVLISTLTGHTGAVSTANFSPDGQIIVTASVDTTARIWQAASGKLLRTLAGHGSYVEAAAFSPDGRHIVTASLDKTARIWDAASGSLVTTLPASGGLAYAAYSPDGRHIATASADKTACLWDVASLTLLKVFAGHSNIVTSVAFSPDGRQLLTASMDKTARMWDATADMPALVLGGHRDEPVTASFSRDGQRVLTGSLDQTARVWDAASGAPLATLKGHGGAVLGAAFSPDGRRIATASLDSTVRLWDSATYAQQLVFRQPGAEFQDVAFSPDGHSLVTATNDNIARVIDAQTGATLIKLVGHTGWVRSASFSPDQRRILTSSIDKTARLWDATTGAPLATLSLHAGDVMQAAFSPDGTRIVTASTDQTARIWDGATGALLHVLTGHEGAVRAAVFSPDGQRVVTASADGSARVWAVASGAPLISLTAQGAGFRGAAFSPDGKKIVTTSSDRLVRIWDASGYLGEADLAFIRATSSRGLDTSLRAQYALGPAATAVKAPAIDACKDDAAGVPAWTAGAAAGDGRCHQRLAEHFESVPLDLAHAFFHHAVAARLLEQQGFDDAAQEERYRREALAWTLPRATVTRLMIAADHWKPGDPPIP